MNHSRRDFLRHLALTATAGLAVGALSGCAGSGPRTKEQLVTDIDDYLNQTLPDGAAATVTVAREGKILYCKGFGESDKEGAIKAGPDTVYDIGSITKQFTAAAILKLELAGALATTDPVSQFFDRIPDDKADMTIHHLLTHTSGLTEQLGDDYATLSRQDLIAGAAASELLWAPGDGYRYSNLGYSVLGAIVESVAETDYESYLAAELFTPAGMEHTGYVQPDWRREQIAVEYDGDSRPQGTPDDHPWDVDGPYWNLRANGGILSTAMDMGRWHLALEGDAVLTESAKEKLFTPYVKEEGEDSHYGYGWVILRDESDRPVAWHNGGNGLSYAEFLRSPQQRAAIFWNTNQTQKAGQWNLEEEGLTEGLAALLDS